MKYSLLCKSFTLGFGVITFRIACCCCRLVFVIMLPQSLYTKVIGDLLTAENHALEALTPKLIMGVKITSRTFVGISLSRLVGLFGPPEDYRNNST